MLRLQFFCVYEHNQVQKAAYHLPIEFIVHNPSASLAFWVLLCLTWVLLPQTLSVPIEHFSPRINLVILFSNLTENPARAYAGRFIHGAQLGSNPTVQFRSTSRLQNGKFRQAVVTVL